MIKATSTRRKSEGKVPEKKGKLTPSKGPKEAPTTGTRRKAKASSLTKRPATAPTAIRDAKTASASPSKDRSLPPSVGRGASPSGARSSKQAAVLAMLRQKGGTTIAAIMKATGWQQHSVRGFLTGAVRKRLKLNLASDKVAGERRYRIGKSAGSK